MKKVLDKKTGEIVHAYDFGGSDIVKVPGTPPILVWADKSQEITSYIRTYESLSLIPSEESIEIDKPTWEIVSHQDISTCNWRVTVKNSFTGEVKSGVYPFNLQGKVYQLPCPDGNGPWVIASCGGYKIKTGTDPICYILEGTGETICKLNISYPSNNPLVLTFYMSHVEPGPDSGYIELVHEDGWLPYHLLDKSYYPRVSTSLNLPFSELEDQSPPYHWKSEGFDKFWEKCGGPVYREWIGITGSGKSFTLCFLTTGNLDTSNYIYGIRKQISISIPDFSPLNPWDYKTVSKLDYDPVRLGYLVRLARIWGENH